MAAKTEVLLPVLQPENPQVTVAPYSPVEATRRQESCP